MPTNEQIRRRYAEDADYRRRTLAKHRAVALTHKAEISERRRRMWQLEHGVKTRTRRYGISMEEYHALMRRQGGACAICKKIPEKPLCIDNCHLTGKVRGLLCTKCNSGIGFYEDDPNRLRAAIDYLARAGRSAADRGPARHTKKPPRQSAGVGNATYRISPSK